MKPAFAVLSLAILSRVAIAQPAPPPIFETADAHVSAPGTRENGGFLPAGRFECTGTTMLKLVSMAYYLNTDLVTGGPDWLASDRFDITAKAASHDATRGELRKMLQNLLAARFGLVVHDDRKLMPAYLMGVGKKGTQLQPTANTDAPDCPLTDGDPDLIHRACHAFTMADLSALLPQVANNYVDRPVVDNTALQGRYDFRLDWMNKPDYIGAKAIGRPTVSMFDALDRLGLTLEPGTGPVRVIVVDRVNRTPSADVAVSVTAPDPEFEVAEVRTSKYTARRELIAAPDGQIEMMGCTLRDLIKSAFEVRDDRVRGGPKWLDTDRYDVIAKSRDVMSPHAISGMLKALLIEKFKLATHHEDEPVVVSAMVQGKHTKLQQSSGSERSDCKLSLAGRGREFVCRNTTMGQFAERLPDVAQAYFIHPLVDMTGLTGSYDFTLTWTPKSRLPRATKPSTGEAATPEGDLTVFEALDQQLGIKVEDRKRPMPVVVIDSAERTL